MLLVMKALLDACVQKDIPENVRSRISANVWNRLSNGAVELKVKPANQENRMQLKQVVFLGEQNDEDCPIGDCYLFFLDEVKSYIGVGNAGEKEARAEAVLDTVEFKLQLAALELDANEQPNKVFETINARGEHLRQSELIKNTVMYEAGVVEDEERAKGYWLEEWEPEHEVRESERRRTLRHLESYLVRRTVMRMNTDGAMHRQIASVIKAMNEAVSEGGSIGNTVAESLNQGTVDATRWPSDHEIRRQLKGPLSVTASRRDIILGAMEECLKQNEGSSAYNPPLKPGNYEGFLLFPSDEASWSSDPPVRKRAGREFRQEAAANIGNLTVIAKGEVSKNIEKADWESKFEKLRDESATAMNAALTSVHRDKWDEDDTAERSQEMAELFIKTYPKPTDNASV